MRFIFAFIFIIGVQVQISGQAIIRDSVRPRTTDINIPADAYNLWHYMLKTNQDTMHSLVVFMPGTYRAPADYKFMTEEIAKLGYHVIGLMYKTEPAINPICSYTNDVTCHWRARMENVDGVDRHPSVSVDVSNSILNRLTKVLQYLIANKPGEGWDQYYSNNQLQWDKIIVTGHSQGGLLAGVIGKSFPVKRVVMFSAIDYLNSGNIPNWIDNTTGHEKYFTFFNSKDELIPFIPAQIGYDKLGMTQYGSMVNVGCNTSPFKNSHILYTTYTPTTSLIDKYHNGTALDTYIENETAYKASLKEAIKYLFKK